uniref:Uncharacterized protein n=1 Tax=Rhizophagus irregularis (strain DAOM 181602 / DAOM 197198 / MUCL 43194) TaxID=747089 RepID=U9THF1_RHIID
MVPVWFSFEKFGETANPANFTSQAQATNIQPTTLSLIFSIALYAASRSWDNFSTQFFRDIGDVKYDEGVTDDGLDESSEDESDEDEDELMVNKLGLQTPIPVVEMPPILPDMEITPVDQTVIPKKSQKKDKQKRVLQLINKSRTNQQRQKHQPKIPKRKRNHLNLRLHRY